MKKSQIGTIFILVITIGLIGAIAYFSMLLNDKSTASVTQIKKTKASAVTYHKLLALNATPDPNQANSSDSGNNSSSSLTGSGGSSSLPVPTESLLAYNSSSLSSTGEQASSVSSDESQSLSEVIEPSPTTQPTDVPIAQPTAAPTLLVYRTISPTLIPSRDTGVVLPDTSSSSKSKSATVSSVSSRTPTIVSKELPETGWVQLSTILFIVAATTIFVSFLF